MNNNLNITILECHLCNCNANNLPKTGPNLRADIDLIDLLKIGGFEFT